MQDEIICIYGKVDSKFCLKLKKTNKKIIFLENDKKKFDFLLKQVNSLFKDKKIEAIFLKDNLDQTLKEIAWKSIYLNLKILKSTKEKRIKFFGELTKKLKDMHLGANLVANLYSDYGKSSLKNAYLNLFIKDNLTLFESYANQFKNVPAIIVGAAPSLEKNISLLNQVYNKALIIAGGTAINVLSKNNIKCHLTGFVDPISSFTRIKDSYFFENIFFYQNQVNHKLLKMVQAKKIMVAEHGSHPLESWLYDKCSLKQKPFEGGWNVFTFLMKIATKLGCNPIILLGMDLCYKKDKYAKNVIGEKDKYKLIKVKNIFEEEVFTQGDWLLARSWIEEFISTNKNIEFINASEGLFVKHLKNKAFIDIIKNDLKLNMDLLGFVHSIYENKKKIRLDKSQIINTLKILLDSLNKIEGLCDEYLSKIEFNNRDYNFIRFQKEIAYSFLLEPNWQIWKHVILRNIKNEKLDIFINKLIFFKNVASDHSKILRKIL